MKILWLVLPVIAVTLIGVAASAHAEGDATTTRFAVMRDGQQIGTTVVNVRKSGANTTTEVQTQVQVKIAYITVYHYEQTETEQWKDGKLEAMSAVTDDNGTMHKVNAHSDGAALALDADGKTSKVDPSLIPVSLWNAALVKKNMAINPQDGSVTRVSVVDHGDEDVVLRGRSTQARHYSIATTFPQDVWYDQHHQLIRVEMRGSDGSKIHYQPG